jgi:hypothetical protein
MLRDGAEQLARYSSEQDRSWSSNSHRRVEEVEHHFPRLLAALRDLRSALTPTIHCYIVHSALWVRLETLIRTVK